MGGAVIQWLRDGLGIIQSAPEVNSLAANVSDSGGVVLVPAFTGFGAPYWDAKARGTPLGMTRGTKAISRNHEVLVSDSGLVKIVGSNGPPTAKWPRTRWTKPLCSPDSKTGTA